MVDKFNSSIVTRSSDHASLSYAQVATWSLFHSLLLMWYSVIQFDEPNAYFRVLFIRIQHTTSLSQANGIHTQSQIGISIIIFQAHDQVPIISLVIGIHIKVQVYYYGNKRHGYWWRSIL